jgi:hypothetical protein
MNDNSKGWPEMLAGLRDVDWSRANRALWEGRALVGGKINRSRTSVVLTQIFALIDIHRCCGPGVTQNRRISRTSGIHLH